MLDFGHIADEPFIVHKVEKLLQLIQVGNVFFSNALEEIGRTNVRMGKRRAFQ